MANIQDERRNQYMLKGLLAQKGYDWWWHSFTAYHEETGEPQPFYIEFFACNPALGTDEPIFGQLGDDKPSYLMINCGIWGRNSKQLHRFFGWNDVKIAKGAPFSVEAVDCYLDETYSKGSIEVTDALNHPEWLCDNGSISWDLKIDKRVAFHVGYGTSWLFRFLNSFEMYWHAEGMKTAYSGTVTYNGERYIVRPEDSYGYADKNWGSDFTSPWVWLSSNNLRSNVTGQKLENSVFDIGGGRPKVFGIALNRQLLSDFWYEGNSYEFNFSKFWTRPHTVFECYETDTRIVWQVEQWTNKAKMVTEIYCYKSEMLQINYEAPNGKKLHNRLWNGGNGRGTVKLYQKKGKDFILIDEIAAENVGCEYGEYDRYY